jgi:hypothetical protein
VPECLNKKPPVEAPQKIIAEQLTLNLEA